VFGARRARGAPLVRQAFDWEHGVFLGATMSSEKTAAAAGTVGELRFDPMAMLPFCGYNMADYFSHWLKLSERDVVQLPRIFHVNWFRKDADGKFLWPGFGENSRVLAWVFRRCDDEAQATETPIGYVPDVEHLELNGLDRARVAEALSVDLDEARAELEQTEAHLDGFGEALPAPIRRQFEALKDRLR
jgi:phosphoenolpyruvate carboxykinase (GTP)